MGPHSEVINDKSSLLHTMTSSHSYLLEFVVETEICVLVLTLHIGHYHTDILGARGSRAPRQPKYLPQKHNIRQYNDANVIITTSQWYHSCHESWLLWLQTNWLAQACVCPCQHPTFPP